PKRTTAHPEAPDASPEAMARWAIGELVRMGLEAGEASRVIELLLRAAELPFGRRERRTMRAEAATHSLELQDFDGATRIFAALFDEDASDEVAVQVVPMFAELLEARGMDAEVVTLWERQATWRETAKRSVGAAELWARAAEIAENRLHDE